MRVYYKVVGSDKYVGKKRMCIARSRSFPDWKAPRGNCS